MKIVNETDLSYANIGVVIDDVIKKDIGSTHYVGQVEYFEFTLMGIKYKCQLRYLKRYVEWRFIEKC